MSISILTSEDIEKWWFFYEKLPLAGIYHRPDYVMLMARHYYPDSCAELFVYEEADNFIYYPYYKRPIPIEVMSPDVPEDSLYDISSSWYYGGPLSSQVADQSIEMVRSFEQAFSEYCIEEGIVAGFDRLDPNLFNHKLFLCSDQELTENRETVFVDLTKDDDLLWKELHESCRRNIRKAQNRGIVMRQHHSCRDLELFWHIYNAEMERKNSVNRLKFSLEFFSDIFDSLGDSMQLLVAEKDDAVVGGFALINDGIMAHHFLSASTPDAWGDRVNDLMFFSTFGAAKAAGCNIMDFQGGRDGVFKFKSKFSPTRNKFFTRAKIYNHLRYTELSGRVNNLDNNAESSYFPAYRRNEA